MSAMRTAKIFHKVHSICIFVYDFQLVAVCMRVILNHVLGYIGCIAIELFFLFIFSFSLMYIPAGCAKNKTNHNFFLTGLA